MSTRYPWTHGWVITVISSGISQELVAHVTNVEDVYLHNTNVRHRLDL